MYNRYIPQPDGSFQRSRMQDHSRPPEPQKTAPCPPPAPPSTPEPSPRPPCSPPRSPKPCRPPQNKPETEPFGVGAFLRQLLPKDFDTMDLMVILLLLLMSSDNCDDNSALLTLALYLFL